MKKTITRENTVYNPCNCGGNPNCAICKGLGRYIVSTFVETIVVDSIVNPEEDIIDVEIETPLIEDKGENECLNDGG